MRPKKHLSIKNNHIEKVLYDYEPRVMKNKEAFSEMSVNAIIIIISEPFR
jgi:hypothetical protein